MLYNRNAKQYNLLKGAELMLLKIEAMVVIIIGRISSGKMSFSHRLVDNYPLGSGMSLRFDGSQKVLNKAKNIPNTIKERAKNGLFTIVVCDQTSSSEIWNLLSSLGGIETQVLLFDLDEALLDEFLANNHTKYKKFVIVKDLHEFNAIRNMEYPKNVVTITKITNPKKINKIEFNIKL